MEYSLKWIVRILLLEIPFTLCFYPQYILEDQCIIGNETVLYNTTSLGSVGRLITSLNPPYQMNKNCKIIIKPPAGFGVVVSIQKIDFRQPTIDCLDYLKISPKTLCRFKFDLKESLSYFSRGRMEMFYHVQSELNDDIGDGFSLTFTVVSEDLQDCLKPSMFMCDNRRCIPKSLTCDMKNNCGDNSDETFLLCDSTSDSSNNLTQVSDVMYGVAICILVFIMISFCAVMVSRKRHNDDSSLDSDEPRMTPYQTVHPQGFFICRNPAGPSYFQHSKIVHSEDGFTNPCYPMPPPYIQ